METFNYINTMQITAQRDNYLWKIKVIEWNTVLDLTFDDVDPYELIQVAQSIIYQKDTWDWWEAQKKIFESM